MKVLLVILVMAVVLVWPARVDPLELLASRDMAGARVRRRRPVVRVPWRVRPPLVTPEEVLALLEGLAPALGAGLSPAESLLLVVRLNVGEQRAGFASGGGDRQPSGGGGAAAHAVRPHEDAWQDQLAEVGRLAREGVPLAPVWRELAERHGSAELLLLAQAWALSERVGSALSDAVLTVTAMVRARLRQQRRVSAAAAGAKATMNLLTLLPVGGVGVALMVGVSPDELYLQSPASVGCLAAGLFLLAAGRWTVRRLVRRSLEPAPIT